MAWWQEFFGAVGASSQGMFDSSAPSQVRDQVMKWLGYFSASAVGVAGPNMLDPQTCDFCSELGLLDCQVCGARTCLAHSFVSHQAQAVCHECVRSTVGTREDVRRQRSEQHRQQRAERAERSTRKAAASDDKIATALKELGLEREATWEDIRAAHRYLVLKHHPDRVKGAAAKDKATEKLKKVNAAYELLRQRYEKAA